MVSYLRLQTVIQEVFPGRVDVGRGDGTGLDPVDPGVPTENVRMFSENDVSVGDDVDFFAVTSVGVDDDVGVDKFKRRRKL